MKTVFYILSFFVFICQANAQTTDLRKKHFNLKGSVALQQYDAVSYVDNSKAVKGNSNYKYTYQGATYYFSSQANLDKFKANPSKYEPAYGGWCAYAMGKNGDKVSVDPSTFKVINGKLYLFYNAWGNNTLTSWNKDEQNLKMKADKNWSNFVK